MSKQIKFYLDGMTSWAALSYADRVWVCANRPDAAPLGAVNDFMAA